ncbi:phosphatidate cytidylyltransferase [Hyphomicrobiales bacterium]|nr:phosphatidate cytidylyltransferase [Hyphomicrobiales bacterium]
MTLPEDFITRLVSSIFLLLIVLFPLIQGEIFFKTFLIIISPIILFEWMRMVSNRFWIIRGLSASFGICSILTFSVIGPISVLIFFLTFLSICIFGKLTNSSYKLSSFGFIYISLAILSILWFRESSQGLVSLSIIISTIIVTDASAYIIGNWLGGPKLFKVISPNKTISGFIGAIIFGVGWFYLIVSFFIEKYEINYLPIGILIVITSIFGDLFISFLKRKAGIKDSGFILPGHGGLLDRADSILPVFIVIPIIIIIFDLIKDPSLIILGW